MKRGLQKKHDQLGIPPGTAAARLRKQLLFRYVVLAGHDVCFRCNQRIESVDQFSIDHKQPWLDTKVELFWDMENIAFSHLGCNVRAKRYSPRIQSPHGTQNRYNRYRCRCDECRKWNRDKGRRERRKHC